MKNVIPVASGRQVIAIAKANEDMPRWPRKPPLWSAGAYRIWSFGPAHAVLLFRMFRRVASKANASRVKLKSYREVDGLRHHRSRLDHHMQKLVLAEHIQVVQ